DLRNDFRGAFVAQLSPVADQPNLLSKSRLLRAPDFRTQRSPVSHPETVGHRLEVDAVQGRADSHECANPRLPTLHLDRLVDAGLCRRVEMIVRTCRDAFAPTDEGVDHDWVGIDIG